VTQFPEFRSLINSNLESNIHTLAVSYSPNRVLSNQRRNYSLHLGPPIGNNGLSNCCAAGKAISIMFNTEKVRGVDKRSMRAWPVAVKQGKISKYLPYNVITIGAADFYSWK
jgi:hypothetical protein